MERELLKNLNDLGFSDREALIYMALVKRLETTAYDLAKILSLPRTTVYQTLEKMRKQGLVLTSQKNKVLHYSTESFSHLSDLVEIRKKALALVIPKLQELSSKSGLKEPTSHVYIGLEATKTVWEDILLEYKNKSIKQTYGTATSKIFTIYGNYFFDWVKRRRNLKLFTGLIFPESDRNKIPVGNEVEKESFRFLNDEYLYPGELTVYGNKTAIFSFDKKEPHVIVIESPEVAEIFNRMLKLMWSVSKA